ncbi:hypothetical protein [Streptacidiphilus jiangxiensis]|uniref:Uncharacterized protein n=1 Tax=Streptacidiphilus jiangxiensis TaxID=235985 RepID=A0A1H7N6L6_STRJI|nr:hypothetical protein [Streptacidiphilus jiangxiensis]SEL18555.1 hypothetical protein SAMN05414137_106211 [Streptacidiphilus jiangxiensis]
MSGESKSEGVARKPDFSAAGVQPRSQSLMAATVTVLWIVADRAPIGCGAALATGPEGGRAQMGGDTWWATGPYQEDPAVAFRQAQERALRDQDLGAWEGKSLAELWQDEEWQEYVFTEGTGSVLDFFDFSADPARPDEVGMMRLLTDQQLRACFPDGRPGFAAWNDALLGNDLPFPPRACGRCIVLYRDGRPAEMGYWGRTAD